MKSLPTALATTGAVFLASTIALAITQAPLGSHGFFASAAVAGTAYLVMLGRVWNEAQAPRRLLWTALALALAFRAPLVGPRVGPDSDMVRYVWDGRVQTLGYNPYLVVPADPAMRATHTDETLRMPSLRAHTPYPPGAQLFFRLVVSLHDSTRAMKLALVACDLLTMAVLWQWLLLTGRSEWLVLAYAWNPLVVFEVAHSGHLDALGALSLAASAYWLARRRTALASIAFVLAVATKLLPIVLLPLYWKRVRLRDALAAGALLGLVYLAFTRDGIVPLGAVPNVVAYIRFNGPLFEAIARVTNPQAAALTAVGLGMLVAAWARWRLDASHPAAWTWPMAVALACAPVVYPWYLLYLTPFLFVSATLPLTAWTFSAIPAYIVWHIARNGGRWVVPPFVMFIEYAIPVALGGWLLSRAASSRNSPEPAPKPLAAEPGRTP